MSGQELNVSETGSVDFRKIYEEVYGQWAYPADYQIDPAKTAMVIIDMQPAFTNSSIGYMKAFATQLNTSLDYFDSRVRELVLPNISKLLSVFRKEKMLIVYIVSWSETEDLSDMNRRQKRAIRKFEEAIGEQVWRKWNPGMNVCEEIDPQPYELVLHKRDASAFLSSMLPLVLKNAGIESVVLTGCNTNGCVFESACSAANMSYDIILVSDATACFAPTLQDEAENWISKFYGIVCTTEQTIEVLRGKSLS